MLYAVFAFVLLQLVVGALAARRVRSQDDFLLAGRRVGPFLAAASIFATWFGAESCLAAAGDAYRHGVSIWSTEPLAYGICLVLMGLWFAGRLWHLRITTLPEYFGRRFGRVAERLAAVLLLPSSVLWAAAQIRAFGHVVVEHADGAIHLEAAIALAAVVAIAYTMLGGLLADIYTDVVQGFVLILGLGVLAWAVLANTPADGGAPPTPTEPPTGSMLDLVEAWAVPICGSVLAQEALSRSFAARSATVARTAAVAGGLCYLLVGLVPLSLGAVAPTLLPGLDEPESVLLRLAGDHLPTVLRVLFVSALVAAILSTVDSCLLVAASVVTRNLLPTRFHAGIWPARLACGCVGLVAFGLALSSDTVHDLVEEASGFGSAGVFVLGVLGLYTRFGGPWAGCGALLAGLVVWVGTRHLTIVSTDHPYLWSLAAAAVGAGLGGSIDRRRRARPAGP
ncbi:MAG: sodium:solute symporter [Planctomycetes bacterium]|nr:sodium:solute symporter [Planctomycetota bacterium]